MATETLPELKKVLLNEDGQTALALRFRALFSLKDMGEKGDNGAIDVIAEGFKDDSELLKHELAYVLGQTKNFHAVKPLQGVLADTNQQAMVRHEAAEALGALGDKGSVAMLQEYFENDPLEVIRETCELALERIKWENSEAAKTETLQKSAYTSIDPAPPLPTDQAEGTDKATVEKLQKTLMDKSQSLFHRYRAMFRLRDIGTEDAVLALATGFEDSSALFRHEIAYVFGQMSDPASVPALIKVLGKSHEEAMVRHEAAEALGSIATDDVLPILKKFAEDKDQVVRESAIVALDMYEYENSNEVEYAH